MHQNSVIQNEKSLFCAVLSKHVNTETLYAIATQNILDRWNKTYDWSVKEQVIGLTGKEAAQKVIEILELPITLDEYQKLALEQFNAVMPQADLMPGAEQLITHLAYYNIPIAVATSSSFEGYCLKTTKHRDLFELFDLVVTGSDPAIKHGKPSPDIFLVSASRFIPPANAKNCLVFDDAPNGVRAALDAGMQVVMVPDQQTSPELCEDATVQVSSLEEVRLELFGLPSLNLTHQYSC